jgi:hypothetical protein
MHLAAVMNFSAIAPGIVRFCLCVPISREFGLAVCVMEKVDFHLHFPEKRQELKCMEWAI